MGQRFALELAWPANVIPPGATAAPQLYTAGLDADTTQLKWSTAIGVGFEAADIGMFDGEHPRYAYLPNDAQIRPFAHTVLRANGASMTLFEGRAMILTRAPGGGDYRGFTAHGYGLSALLDDWYSSTDTATNLTSGTLLTTVLQSKAPLITPGPSGLWWVDPGVTHHPADFDSMTPKQIVDQVSKEGGNSAGGAYWDFSVWERRVARFLPRIPPATPDYVVPPDSDITDWKEDFTNAYAVTTVHYTPSGGAAANTAASASAGGNQFVRQYQVFRQTLLQGGQLTATGAAALRDAYQALHAGPEISCTLTRDEGRGIELAGGGELPPYVVRAGQWVQVGMSPPLIVIKTEYDANNRRLTATLGWYPRSFRGVLRQLYLALLAQHGNTNPNSGAKQATG